MRNKLLISIALIAAALAAASCEKTPNGEGSAEAQKQGESAPSSERPPGATAQQQAGQEQDTKPERTETQAPTPQSDSQITSAANEQQNKVNSNEQGKDQVRPEATQTQPSTGQGAHAENEATNTPATAQQSQPDQQDGAPRQSQGPNETDTSRQEQMQPNKQATQDEATKSTAESQQPQRGGAGGSVQNESGTSRQAQAQPNKPEERQLQSSEPRQQQATAGVNGGLVNLSREQLRQAQTILKQKGFDVGPLDGILGPRTRKALISFQQQHGLQATGQMDQRTVAALGITTGSGQEHSQIPGASTTGRSGTGTP